MKGREHLTLESEPYSKYHSKSVKVETGKGSASGHRWSASEPTSKAHGVPAGKKWIGGVA